MTDRKDDIMCTYHFSPGSVDGLIVLIHVRAHSYQQALWLVKTFLFGENAGVDHDF